MTTAKQLPITASQTIGPFSHEAWQWAEGASATQQPRGPAITLSGRLLDGAGAPVDDAQIECWMPDAVNAERDLALPGFRRIPTGTDGEFSFHLAQPAPGQPAAWVTIFTRGLLLHASCAVFLEDDAALEQAPVLLQVPAARRATLIASRTAPNEYRWDIRLQGDQETVFFDFT